MTLSDSPPSISSSNPLKITFGFMPIVTMVVGMSLMVVGLLGFVKTGSQHPTALIPFFFGLVLDMCGGVALVPQFRKHAMHVVAMIALLGVLGTFDGVIGGIQWLAGTPPVEIKKAAVISKLIMFALCLILEALCVNSFIQARRARRLAEPGFPVNPIS